MLLMKMFSLLLYSVVAEVAKYNFAYPKCEYCRTRSRRTQFCPNCGAPIPGSPCTVRSEPVQSSTLRK